MNKDCWQEMSYNKYKQFNSLFERLYIEEPDVFDIDEDEEAETWQEQQSLE